MKYYTYTETEYASDDDYHSPENSDDDGSAYDDDTFNRTLDDEEVTPLPMIGQKQTPTLQGDGCPYPKPPKSTVPRRARR